MGMHCLVCMVITTEFGIGRIEKKGGKQQFFDLSGECEWSKGGIWIETWVDSGHNVWVGLAR